MPPRQVPPPKPRAGQQRHRPIHRTRLEGLGSPAPTSIRGQSPSLVRHLSTTPPPSQPIARPGRECTNPTCPKPDVSLQDDGSYVCNTCGCVVDQDSGLVAEQTFSDLPGGRTALQGTQVGEGQTHAKTYQPGLATGPAGREATANRDKTQRWARTVMNGYTNLLGVEESEVMAGMQIFKLAWAHRFVQGRTIEGVAVVCLYLACRRRTRQDGGVRRPYYALMLIDFAEKLNVDVFALGKMYLDLVRKLYLDKTHNDGRLDKDVTANLLAMGPEVLIDKFVKEMDFAPHGDKVRNDAIKIVSRMKRDWMSTGRRPAGVCGAAIILAARMNNFRRTTREVVLTAKVTEITINKRLEEFKETPSSNLSVNDFRDESVLDAISASNPPAYERNINPQPKRKRGRPKKHPLPMTAAEIEEPDQSESHTENSMAREQVQRLSKRARIDADGYKIPDLPQPKQSPIDPRLVEGGSSDDREQTSSIGNGQVTNRSRKQGRPPGSRNWRAPPTSAAEEAIEEQLERDVLEALRENPDLDPNHEYEAIAQGPPSSPEEEDTSDVDESTRLQLVEQSAINTYQKSTSSKEGPPGPAVNTDIGNTGNISLSPTIGPNEFDDDPDVSVCLLSEAEKRIKETVWISENADWLRQDHAKRIKRELKEAEMREKGIDPAKQNQKKRQKIRKDGSKRAGRLGDVSYLNESDSKQATTRKEGDEGISVHAETGAQELERTAADSVRKMMQTRGVYSRRVNYDVLESLYAFEGSESRSRSRSGSASQGQSGREGSVASSILTPDAIYGSRGGRRTRRNRNKAGHEAENRESRRRDQRTQEGQNMTEGEGQSASDESPSSSISPDRNEQAGTSTTSPHPNFIAEHEDRSKNSAYLPTPDPTQNPRPSSTTTRLTSRNVSSTSKPGIRGEDEEDDHTDSEKGGEEEEDEDESSEEEEEQEVDIEAAFDGGHT